TSRTPSNPRWGRDRSMVAPCGSATPSRSETSTCTENSMGPIVSHQPRSPELRVPVGSCFRAERLRGSVDSPERSDPGSVVGAERSESGGLGAELAEPQDQLGATQSCRAAKAVGRQPVIESSGNGASDEKGERQRAPTPGQSENERPVMRS